MSTTTPSAQHSVKSSKKPNKKSRKDPFIIVTPLEASGAHVDLSSRRVGAQIYLDHLRPTECQRSEIERLYLAGLAFEHLYRCLDQDDQLSAAALLASLGLDTDSRESLTNRWHTRWSQPSGQNKEKTWRVLYQCACGYNHSAAGTKSRKNPLPFTECPAHVELTYVAETQKILRIRGLVEHNKPCLDAEYTSIPTRPLHPSVFAVALRQLAEGVNLDGIMEKNKAMFRQSLYPEQPSDLRKSGSAYRWLIKRHDTRSLYRQYNRLHGVNVTEAAHINVDEWLDKDSPRYNADIAAAVFHYSARAQVGDRFEVCIATKAMKEAAWAHGHKSQIMLDGTFGVSEKKLLLFILMGLDEKRRGEPLALFLFSAPSGNRHTAAGYNTEILAKLLSKWRGTLGKRNGEGFSPAVAITDTDLMERNALAQVFPNIWLLICKFHLRQSWRNHRNKLLRGKSPVHMSVKARMSRVEAELASTTDFNQAKELLAKERAFLEGMEQDHPSVAKNGLDHLTYLGEGYWMKDESLWRSWSEYGRRYAAVLLECEIEGVLTTTNHLESFNGVLKRRHLRRWQRGNRRLRIDILIKLLIQKILPAIFEQRTLEREEDARWDHLLLSLPGGAALVKGLRDKSRQAFLHPVAYLSVDETRQQSAVDLLQHDQISQPTYEEHTRTFLFSCYSAYATIYDLHPSLYSITLSLDGFASCSCPDFARIGGACKHLRAALLRLDAFRATHPHTPIVSLPASEEEARAHQAANLSSRLKDSSAHAALAVSPADASTSPARGIDASVIDATAQEANDTLFEEIEGDEDEGADEDEEEIESDLESVATDAGEEDEFLFTALDEHGNARRAIEQQTLARVLFDLTSVAPRLGQLGGYLKELEGELSPDDMKKAADAREHITMLADQLDRIMKISATSDKAEASSLPLALPEKPVLSAPVFPGGRDSHSITDTGIDGRHSGPKPSGTERLRRKRAALEPPSPEKGSAKRHQSYSKD